MNSPFNSDTYIQLQSEKILERIETFNDKLYLEFGGKIFDDYHASRVLPGFLPDTKIKMLKNLAHKSEIIITVSAKNLEKIRQDSGLHYDAECFRMIDFFQENDFLVNSVVITRYTNSKACQNFIKNLEKKGVSYHFHYEIEGYPANISNIISENGYGKNDYIKTTKPLVIVTAPGPGSGKIAVCLSQLYHDSTKNISSWFAKFETFPVWNLPINHPVNIAYESATLDISDNNEIDPFHLEAYNTVAVNYNRDIEVFPILKEIFTKIYGNCPYNSPTDMGVNMLGFCFDDEEKIILSAKKEILRRYFGIKNEVFFGKMNPEKIIQAEILLQKAKINESERKVIEIARRKSQEKIATIMALETENWDIITGKSSPTMTAPSALIINTLKILAHIQDDMHIISPEVIKSIQNLKKIKDKTTNTALNLDEILIALSISATTSQIAKKAINVIWELKWLDAHSSKILNNNDIQTLKNLEIAFSMDSIL